MDVRIIDPSPKVIGLVTPDLLLPSGGYKRGGPEAVADFTTAVAVDPTYRPDSRGDCR